MLPAGWPHTSFALLEPLTTRARKLMLLGSVVQRRASSFRASCHGTLQFADAATSCIVFVMLDVTRLSCYSWLVIVSCRDKHTSAFASGKRVKAFSGFERSARLKLDRLEAATSLGDLAALPDNRFAALVGDRKGQYSIRINDQWRICFEWASRSPGPSNVEIVDYH